MGVGVGMYLQSRPSPLTVAHAPATSQQPPLTSRESTAAYMMSIQPLKVA